MPLKLLALLCLFALPVRSAADELPLRKGEAVTILRTDGTTEKARFDSQVADPPRLRLAKPDARNWGGGSWNYELPTEAIAQLQSAGDHDFKERRMLTGTLLGMAVGGVLGLAFGGEPDPGPSLFGLGNSYSFSNGRMQDMAAGMAGGAVLGFVLGVLTAPSTGPSRQWTFDAAGNAASTQDVDREP